MTGISGVAWQQQDLLGDFGSRRDAEPVLMALNREYYELIWQGLKTHEFRRRFIEDTRTARSRRCSASPKPCTRSASPPPPAPSWRQHSDWQPKPATLTSRQPHTATAESHPSAGEDEQARQHWQQAITLYSQLGPPEPDQVQSRLSTQEAKTQQ